MPDLPSHDKYDPPFSVQEKASLYKQFVMGNASAAPVKPASPAQTPEPYTMEEPTADSVDTPVAPPPTRISTRANHVLASRPQAASDLLSWFSLITSRGTHPLQIDSNGFMVTIQVVDVKQSDGHLIITMSYDTGVSFSLETGAQIKIRWEEGKDWSDCVYLNKFDVGTGFPFFFMVFLA